MRGLGQSGQPGDVFFTAPLQAREPEPVPWHPEEPVPPPATELVADPAVVREADLAALKPRVDAMGWVGVGLMVAAGWLLWRGR